MNATELRKLRKTIESMSSDIGPNGHLAKAVMALHNTALDHAAKIEELEQQIVRLRHQVQ